MWLRGKMEIERSVCEDPRAVVYHLSGVLTDTKECYDFLEDVRKEIREGYLNVVLDLGKIPHVTSAGVGLLAACFTSAKNAGGRFCVVEVPERARVLLELVRLWDAIEHYATEEEALAALK